MKENRSRRMTGAKKEEAAANYLIKQGYEILERNYHCRFAELDIVAREGEYLCFVEVKYRNSSRYEAPEGVISFKKMQKVCQGASFFMRENRILPDTPIRFDVVMMIDDEITLIRNAFDYISNR